MKNIRNSATAYDWMKLYDLNAIDTNRIEINKIEKNILVRTSPVSPTISVFRLNQKKEMEFVKKNDIKTWLLEIMWRNKTFIENFRSMPLDSYKKKVTKQQLYAATISGCFYPSSSQTDLQTYTSCICIDIDGKDNLHITDLELLKTQLSDMQGLIFTALSSGGQGLFCVFKYENPEKHLNHYFALESDFWDRGIRIDTACKNINRLRYISFDSNPFINFDTKIYSKQLECSVVKYKQNKVLLCQPPESLSAMNYNLLDHNQKTEQNVIKLVHKIEFSGVDITSGHDDWIQIGRALGNEFGERGRELFHRVSRYYSNGNKHYTQSECDRVFSYCLNGCDRVKISSFFKRCKEFQIMLK